MIMNIPAARSFETVSYFCHITIPTIPISVPTIIVLSEWKNAVITATRLVKPLFHSFTLANVEIGIQWLGIAAWIRLNTNPPNNM